MAIGGVGGSFAWRVGGADAIDSAAEIARAPSTACKTGMRPEVIVFDRFQLELVDVNRDGFGDVDHGAVTAAIIRGRTGAKMTIVDLTDDRGGIEALDELLRRKDVSNLYLNFSVELGPKTYQRILRLAQRGASVYIAAGNDSINPLTLGQPHPNIHVVGASGGVVGSSKQSKTIETIQSPRITVVANGKVSFANVRGGVDLTGDGAADLVPRAIPNDAAGQRLAAVDVTAAVVKKGTLSWEDRGSRGDRVVSIRAMRASGLMPEATVKSLAAKTGLSTSRLDTMYLHIGQSMLRTRAADPFVGPVLYQIGKRSGRLETVVQNPPTRPFTSWAAPEQLSNDLIKARRCR